MARDEVWDALRAHGKSVHAERVVKTPARVAVTHWVYSNIWGRPFIIPFDTRYIPRKTPDISPFYIPGVVIIFPKTGPTEGYTGTNNTKVSIDFFRYPSYNIIDPIK
jgi:hypothetical protein